MSEKHFCAALSPEKAFQEKKNNIRNGLMTHAIDTGGEKFSVAWTLNHETAVGHERCLYILAEEFKLIGWHVQVRTEFDQPVGKTRLQFLAAPKPPETASNDPATRRCDIDRLTPAEQVIRMALRMVEAMPANPTLTDASMALSTAAGKVADYVEAVEAAKAAIKNGVEPETQPIDNPLTDEVAR